MNSRAGLCASTLFCLVTALIGSACGPRYIIIPDRLTSAQKVAVMEWVVEGPAQYETQNKTSVVVPLRHSLSIATTTGDLVKNAGTVLADDGRVTVIPTDAVVAAAGYQLLPSTPPEALRPGYMGTVPSVSATGLKGTGKDMPSLVQKAIGEAGADAGILIHQAITFVPSLAIGGNGTGKLRATVTATIVGADGAMIYQESFNEESEVNIPEIMGIADEHSLKEAINDLGTRSLNRLRSVLKSGAPVNA